MQEAPPLLLARTIHQQQCHLVLAVTGGGSLAISHLLTVPGGSRTILECLVPYASPALDNLLGAAPEQYCSADTARAMAVAAWDRGRKLLLAQGKPLDSSLLGVGCTASLASDRPKRGPHRAHLAIHSCRFTHARSLHLAKDLRSRGEEESLVAAEILNLLAQALEIPERCPAPLKANEERLDQSAIAQPAWTELMLEKRRSVRQPPSTGTPKLVFPGAFHPRHDGHRQMALEAARRTGQVVEHEISVWNVDKPPLDFLELSARAAQFSPDEPLWFTAAPTFVQKSELFPGATFVVGTDTLLRIGEPRYYGNDLRRRDQALDSLTARGCRFLVFYRALDGSGPTTPVSWDQLPIPAALRALCDVVPEPEFRLDISSTQLRAQQRQAEE